MAETSSNGGPEVAEAMKLVLTMDQIKNFKAETRKLDEQEGVAGEDDQSLRGLFHACVRRCGCLRTYRLRR